MCAPKKPVWIPYVPQEQCGCLKPSLDHLCQPTYWKCEQHCRALSLCYLYLALVISGSKGFLSKSSCQGSRPGQGVCGIALCVSEWTPDIQVIRLVGSEVGYEALRGSALLHNHWDKTWPFNLEKILLPAPSWLYCEKQFVTLMLVMIGPLFGSCQGSSSFPLKSKISKEHKSRSRYFSSLPHRFTLSCVMHSC